MYNEFSMESKFDVFGARQCNKCPLEELEE